MSFMSYQGLYQVFPWFYIDIWSLLQCTLPSRGVLFRSSTNNTKAKIEKHLSPYLRFEVNERSARNLRKENIVKKLKVSRPELSLADQNYIANEEVKKTKYKPKFGK